MNPVIQVENLRRQFGDVIAVDGISFEVQAGEVFGLLGHNGAGKTTTTRLLNGVLRPTAGTLRVLDRDPTVEGPALREHTGILTESPSLDDRLTARENLTIYADLYAVPETQVASRVEELLAAFELAERADDRVGGFSKGMKQRLALARALIHHPDLIFLDEPTAGLDPVATRRVHDLIEQVTGQGRTVLLCTHNLVEAQRLCDRVAVLEHGKILALGTPAELGRRYAHRQQIEVEVSAESLDVAEHALRSMPGITGVTHGRNHTLTFSGVTHDRIPDVISGLVSAGVRMYRVTPLEASLEDVYFALHGSEETEEIPV
jgi:ABC-2 type transport system ATP-binding protein